MDNVRKMNKTAKEWGKQNYGVGLYSKASMSLSENSIFAIDYCNYWFVNAENVQCVYKSS